MDPKSLPVYQQKDRILESLADNQVIVVESPTGSGKTTQLPVILYEAGYSQNGIIGVTQPRRIAAISVSEFISKQMKVSMPGLVGYKMRFEDQTDKSTMIKIMTDGILLQEMKLDPYLSKYSVIMVDEAHERSLNIDFILGLLKRVLEERKDFKVIISSATINASVFSAYFGDCPIVKIDTQVFPVTVVWDPPSVEGNPDSVTDKIEEIVNRIIRDKREGDILIFLPGEKAIKDCIQRLSLSESKNKIHIIPLYSRLGKDEQSKVFDNAPFGKRKVIVSTNIAETSVTINGITSVIDSGQAKLNFYNPKTYTSSLVQVPISKASGNQRKGRAGRTQPGFCYRLYTREDYDNRSLFTMEEIYRTDLSEVILRMAELGINDFEHFDFISRPPHSGIIGAMEVLNLLDALDEDRTLSKVGKMMCEFPLLPRLSRMIVESILNYPDVVEDVIIAASFLSTMSPYVLPPGLEMEARLAHHAFRDAQGDFVSYLKMYRAFISTNNKAKYCERNFLDERTMQEIVRIKEQIEIIVHNIGVPILSGGSTEDYLCAVSRGLIQFVCARHERGLFRTIMAERVQIHPGSVMFKENPEFIVAGEIVRTTRMYAMSVSPLQRRMLSKISPILAKTLINQDKEKEYGKQVSRSFINKKEALNNSNKKNSKAERNFTNCIKLSNETFSIVSVKKRKKAILEWKKFKSIKEDLISSTQVFKGMLGVIKFEKYTLLDNEKLDTIIKIASWLNIDEDMKKNWPKKMQFSSSEDITLLVDTLPCVLQVSICKSKTNELGFVSLFTDGVGTYWFRVSRGFHTAINESLASLESLIDEMSENANSSQKEKVAFLYRKLSSFFS